MTTMFSLEVAINAKVDDLLTFLERDNQVIHPYHHLTDLPDGLDMTVNFHSKREGNTISIHTKIYTTKPGKLYPRCYEDLAEGEGNEIMRFEVTRLTDRRSLIKGLYASDNPQIALMFWKRWTRLAVAFDAKFANDAQSKLDELEERFGEQWGWREASSTILGNKIRIYGPLSKQKSEQNELNSQDPLVGSAYKDKNLGSQGERETMATNNIPNVQGQILCELYAAFSKGERSVGIDDLSISLQETQEKIYKELVELDKVSLASAVTSDSYKILPKGAIYTENNKLASGVMISENRAIRAKVLDELADLHERYKGSQALHVRFIAESIEHDVHVILNNAEILEHLGFVMPFLIGDFKITDRGLLDVRNRRERQALSVELKRISELEAHHRGRELQEFFAKLASREGWQVETSVKTSNEEIDVIIYRNREFFLVECKWENKPIEAAVIREFYGKLDAREGVKGIIVSMSSFTKGAIEVVQSQVGKRIILLFGPSDINSIVNDNVELEDSINEKYKHLVTQKFVLFG